MNSEARQRVPPEALAGCSGSAGQHDGPMGRDTGWTGCLLYNPESAAEIRFSLVNQNDNFKHLFHAQCRLRSQITCVWFDIKNKMLLSKLRQGYGCGGKRTTALRVCVCVWVNTHMSVRHMSHSIKHRPDLGTLPEKHRHLGHPSPLQPSEEHTQAPHAIYL